MDPLEAIRRARATRLVDKDGDEVEFELAPALAPADIERLADEVGVPLSRELRALLERTAGIDGGPLQTIDFTGRSLSFGAPDTFPLGLPIAGDGFGNFWILDLTPDELETAPVFFAWHGDSLPESRRHGHERLFAYAPLEKRPGLLHRLFA